MLLGAFVAYYTFRVITTEKENDTYEVELQNTTPQLTGGIIGIRKAEKELQRIGTEFQQI